MPRDASKSKLNSAITIYILPFDNMGSTEAKILSYEDDGKSFNPNTCGWEYNAPVTPDLKRMGVRKAIQVHDRVEYHKWIYTSPNHDFYMWVVGSPSGWGSTVKGPIIMVMGAHCMTETSNIWPIAMANIIAFDPLFKDKPSCVTRIMKRDMIGDSTIQQWKSLGVKVVCTNADGAPIPQ